MGNTHGQHTWAQMLSILPHSHELLDLSWNWDDLILELGIPFLFFVLILSICHIFWIDKCVLIFLNVCNRNLDGT